MITSELAQELFEERSAIREYCGGYDRQVAELLGSRDTRGYFESLYTNTSSGSKSGSDNISGELYRDSAG